MLSWNFINWNASAFDGKLHLQDRIRSQNRIRNFACVHVPWWDSKIAATYSAVWFIWASNKRYSKILTECVCRKKHRSLIFKMQMCGKNRPLQLIPKKLEKYKAFEVLLPAVPRRVSTKSNNNITNTPCQMLHTIHNNQQSIFTNWCCY